jgi:hypothetical protein
MVSQCLLAALLGWLRLDFLGRRCSMNARWRSLVGMPPTVGTLPMVGTLPTVAAMRVVKRPVLALMAALLPGMRQPMRELLKPGQLALGAKLPFLLSLLPPAALALPEKLPRAKPHRVSGRLPLKGPQLCRA